MAPGGGRADVAVLATVALGGAVGSVGRYAVGVALPHEATGFPWATLLVNVSGAFAMGLLVAYLVDRPGVHRLARPFVEPGDEPSFGGLGEEHTAVPEDHTHEHGDACGHTAVRHGDHVDYVHDGHRHAVHGGHYDEH